MLHVLAVARVLVATAPGACTGLGLPAALQRVLGRSDEVAIKSLERASAEADLALAWAAGYIPSASATVVTGPVPAAHGNVLDAALGAWKDARSLIDSYRGYVESQVSLATSECEPTVARAQLEQAIGAPIAHAQGQCSSPERP